MTYKHKRTGQKITTEQLIEMLKGGNEVLRVGHVTTDNWIGAVCVSDQQFRKADIFTYRINDIPFSADWEEVKVGIELSSHELEVLIGALGYSGLASENVELGDVVTKLVSHYHKQRHNFEFMG